METRKKYVIVSTIVKTPFLRNILITSLIVAVIFPLYSIFYIIPSFSSQLTANTEDDAVRTAAHMTTLILKGKGDLTKDYFSNPVVKVIRMLVKEYQLEKLKIFSKQGETVYSTDPKDIGKINKKEYFHNIVAKGNVYTKLVQKNTRSLEDRIVTTDVVETYVPIIANNEFAGAFEIYYDITSRRINLNTLLRRTYLILLSLASILLIAIFAILFKAGKNVLERDLAKEALQNAHEALEIRVAERTSELAESNKKLLDEIKERKAAEEKLQIILGNLREAMGGTIQALAAVVEVRDPYTAGHQRRVADLARAIATEMDLPQEIIDGLRLGGIVHDIGKINVPVEILVKPGKITSTEFSLIMSHTEVGYELLKNIEFPWPIAEMVFQHHEKMDGSGYPNGLSGEKICLEARILCVADVVEAMASNRPYRPALGVDAALDEIEKKKSVLFDPQVVEACLRVFKQNKYQIK